MNSVFKIIVLLTSVSLYSQDYNTPEQQNRDALKSVEIINKIFSATDTSANASFDKLQPGVVDSICNSYKSVRDYEEEKLTGFLGRNIVDIGNNMRYYKHRFANLYISYITSKIYLFKIYFEFTFTDAYVNGKSFNYSPNKEFIDSLINAAKFPIQIAYRKKDNKPYGFSYSTYYNKTKEQLLAYKKDIVFDINFSESDKDLEKEINTINDPAHLLDYGFACSIGGSSPEGLKTFAKLVHYKKIYLIEQLIFSPNPVTRLMANDAIEYYSQKNFYTPSLKISEKMMEVINENTVINTCWGCYLENLTMKEAYTKAIEDKKHLYENFIFIK